VTPQQADWVVIHNPPPKNKAQLTIKSMILPTEMLLQLQQVTYQPIVALRQQAATLPRLQAMPLTYQQAHHPLIPVQCQLQVSLRLQHQDLTVQLQTLCRLKFKPQKPKIKFLNFGFCYLITVSYIYAPQ
jgi:hypothetical protein